MPIGFHVGKTNKKISVDIEEAYEYLFGLGFTSVCCQIYVSGPKNYSKTVKADDYEKISELSNEYGPVLIHGAYVDIPWKVRQKAIANIANEMVVAQKINSPGVVVHLGRGANDLDVIREIMSGLIIREPWKNSEKVPSVIFEVNWAKPPVDTFETPEKLATFFERVRDVKKNISANNFEVGLCVDTAHLFACGVALTSYKDAKKWFNELFERLGDLCDYFCVHLNDSASSLGSGRDKHAALCKGNIWRDYDPESGKLPLEDSGLYFILEYANENNIVTILERDFNDLASDLKLIRNLGFFTVI